ncbi:hypothetical protein PFISCL1PPCAC_23556, partial [Pristionchus fissidentatus]
MILQFLLSFSVFIQVSGSACLLKCKDNYMNGMSFVMADARADWSTEMITPLQHLLSSFDRRSALRGRLVRSCRLNTDYSSCLNACGQEVEMAAQILLEGQRTWNVICDRFYNDTNREFAERILPCWITNGSVIAYRCSHAAHDLQSEVVKLVSGGRDSIMDQLPRFCKTTYNYDRCFTRANADVCPSEHASKLIIYLAHVTSNTLMDLLDRTGKLQSILPESCRDWMNQKGMSSSSALRLQRNRNDAPAAGAAAAVI